MLRNDSRAAADDDGRLPRRREEAAAPRRPVTRGGADPGADCAREGSAEQKVPFEVMCLADV